MRAIATFTLALVLSSGMMPVQADDNLFLERIDVRLFLNHTGTLSGPLAVGEDLSEVGSGNNYWPGPSTETLVDVVVRGVPNGYFDGRRVNVEVRSGRSGAVVAEFGSKVGPLNKQGIYHASFLVQGTGCEPLIIVATLNATTQSLQRRLEFKCSE